MTEVKASAKYLRISPRKLRPLTHGLFGLSPQQALSVLGRYPQKGSEFLKKLILQARANAINNFKLAEENLRIRKIEVGNGPAFKRMDKSHGARFDRGIIKKRTAHLFLTLEAAERAENEKTRVVKPVGPIQSKVSKVKRRTAKSAGQSGKES
jgi:large subunit ribosomal protein L22